MAKITTVKSARKETRCGSCGDTIKVGDGYRWVGRKTGPRSSVKLKRCLKHECRFRPSDLTGSAMGQLYDAQEDFDVSDADTLDEIVNAVQEFASVAREIGEEYQQKAEAMVDGFGHETSSSDEVQERGDGLCEWADELDNWDGEEFDGEDIDEARELVEQYPDLADLLGLDTPEDESAAEEHEELVESVKTAHETLDSWDNWLDEQRTAADDVINDCPV